MVFFIRIYKVLDDYNVADAVHSADHLTLRKQRVFIQRILKGDVVQAIAYARRETTKRLQHKMEEAFDNHVQINRLEQKLFEHDCVSA
jgi:hypothetical protein